MLRFWSSAYVRHLEEEIAWLRLEAQKAQQRYEVPERVTAGERTAELFKFVRSFKARGASEQMARFAVEVFNRDRCEPPKSDEWLLRWFNRAWHQADRPDFAQLTTITEDETLPIVEESAS